MFAPYTKNPQAAQGLWTADRRRDGELEEVAGSDQRREAHPLENKRSCGFRGYLRGFGGLTLPKQSTNVNSAITVGRRVRTGGPHGRRYTQRHQFRTFSWICNSGRCVYGGHLSGGTRFCAADINHKSGIVTILSIVGF